MDKQRSFKKAMMNSKGFTLLEVLIVIAILGALTALALPRFTGVLKNSQIKTDQANARIVEAAVELYQAEKEVLPIASSFEALVTELNRVGYLKNSKINSVSGGNFEYENIEAKVIFVPKTVSDD